LHFNGNWLRFLIAEVICLSYTQKMRDQLHFIIFQMPNSASIRLNYKDIKHRN